MRFPSRCFTALCFLPILVCHHADTTVTAQDNTLLKKRIEELETENKALRKIISEVQKAVAIKSSDSSPNPDGLRVIVLPDDWRI